MNHIVTEELAEIAPDFEIKFYPQKYKRNLMETMIAQEKKTFYLGEVANVVELL